MSIKVFIFDFKTTIIFKNWYLKSLGCDFNSFKTDVMNKISIWDDINSEDTFNNLTNDKDMYRDFWTWYYKIPFELDKLVVGNANDIAVASPLLFQKFIEFIKPTFRYTFCKWLDNNNYSEINF
jgi:hypothetical protein